MPPKKVKQFDFVQMVSRLQENNTKLRRYKTTLEDVCSSISHCSNIRSTSSPATTTRMLNTTSTTTTSTSTTSSTSSTTSGCATPYYSATGRSPGPRPLTTATDVSASNTIFTPPCSECLECSAKLYRDHDPVSVRYFTFEGLKSAKRFNLRCKSCNIIYKYDIYGTPQTFWRLYDDQWMAVLANDCVFVERQLFEFQCNLVNHSWVSFMGFSESYNGTFNLTRSNGFGAKLVSASFFRGELENEMRSLGQLDMFQLVKFDLDREKLFGKIESARTKKAYVHHNCHPNCKAKGRGDAGDPQCLRNTKEKQTVGVILIFFNVQQQTFKEEAAFEVLQKIMVIFDP
ncbi:uncharacterized protein [Asterias amurensis]|uniref:uncharacterized protein n=1 Tax=Asterias amurensis TaxID=7602 RepID=UPI003AB483E9